MNNNTAIKGNALMDALRKLIRDNEDWLMDRILRYAKERDYTRYTSPLQEAWRLSIAGISSSLSSMSERDPEQWELGPDDDFTGDPSAAFGIQEAKLHRKRGVSLSIFLGLLKYYNQSYQELADASDMDQEQKRLARRCIDLFFCRMQIALAQEWSLTDSESLIRELQGANRDMTNEKNKFLTIFESIPSPVVILDLDDQVTDLNTAALRIAREDFRPGSGYYLLPDADGQAGGKDGPITGFGQGAAWLRGLLQRFNESDDEQYTDEVMVPTGGGEHAYRAHITFLVDISGKFSGKVAILEDINDRKRAQEERLAREKLQAVIETAGAACHELNQPLQAMVTALELAIFEGGDRDPMRARLQRIKEEMGRMMSITHGLRRITEHHTTPYLNDIQILDLKKSSRSA